MTARDLEINIERLNTVRSHLWEVQKTLEQLTKSVSDPTLKVKSNEARIVADSSREVLKNVETFLCGLKPN